MKISPFMKLASASRTRRDEPIIKIRSGDKYLRGRALRRGAKFAEYDEAADFGYVWAAHRMGAFDQMFGDDFDQETFKAMLKSYFALGKWFTLRAENSHYPVARGMIPVGLMGCELPERLGRPLLQPHAFWFPWASHRNKVETVLRFLYDLRESTSILIFARPDTDAFFKIMKKYQVLRRIGKAHNHFDKGEHATVWEAK
jgi:hypothetical protein